MPKGVRTYRIDSETVEVSKLKEVIRFGREGRSQCLTIYLKNAHVFVRIFEDQIVIEKATEGGEIVESIVTWYMD